MITAITALIAVLPPWEAKRFPAGCVDYLGELSYKEACKLTNTRAKEFLPLSMRADQYLKSSLDNPFSWKQVLDMYLSRGKLEEFAGLAASINMANTGASIASQQSKAKTIGYINMILEYHLVSNGSLSKKLHEKYSKTLFNVRGFPVCSPNSSKLDITLQLISRYGSVPEYRQLSSWLVKSAPDSFFAAFCYADSYRFGADDGSGSPILPNAAKMIQLQQALCQRFPDKAIPYHMIFAYSEKRNPRLALEAARQYVKLETRPFQSERVARAKEFLQSNRTPS